MSERPSRVLLALGAVCVLAAAALALAPSLVPGAAALERAVVALPVQALFALFVGALLLLVFARAVQVRLASESAAGRTRRTAPQPDEPTLGAAFEETLSTAVGARDRARRRHAQSDVEEELRAVAVTSYRLATDCDAEAAEAAVRAGDWSDDARATAVLGGPEAPSPPLYQWVYDLLRRESAYRRRVRHAVREIRDLQRRGPPEVDA